MNLRTLLVRLLALVVSVSNAYTIIHVMADEIKRGVFNPTHYFGYFTMQSGALTALVMLATFYTPSEQLRSAALSYARGAVTLYMSITILVYHTLESPPGTWRFDEWSTIHVAAPIILLVMWYVLLPPAPEHARWWWLPTWMIYPLGFVAASLIRGMSDKWYPYGFLDVTKNGSVAITIVLLAAGVAVLGYCLLLPSFARREHRHITPLEKEGAY